MTISVVIPTHPGRSTTMLDRALASVRSQTRRPEEIIVPLDTEGRGAGWTKQKGLLAAEGDLVAFLDSDDEFLPGHLAKLEQVILADEDCIMAYSWFEPVGGPDPFANAGHFGKPFNPATPHHTTTTVMVRRWAATAVDGFPAGGEGATAACLNDDWIFLLRMSEFAVKWGKHITHLPERTWRWHMHGLNSSGKPGQGDAR